MTHRIYRILGNDLPYRHAPGQTLRNTRFILRNETHVRPENRRWVLNRIVDRAMESALIRMLDKHGESHIRIPFERAEFLACLAENKDKAFAYLTNVNPARNLAIEDGLKEVEWVFPLDGGCFFPEAGIGELTSALSSVQTPLIVLKMARLQTLAQLKETLCFEERGIPTEKSLGFSRQSRLRFDEERPYGLGDKAALLKKIGVPGPWNSWASIQDVVPSAESFTEKGFMVRLPSGNELSDSGYVLRKSLRDEAFEVSLAYASLSRPIFFKLKWWLRVQVRNCLGRLRAWLRGVVSGSPSCLS